jgi:hypothetical protein
MAPGRRGVTDLHALHGAGARQHRQPVQPERRGALRRRQQPQRGALSHAAFRQPVPEPAGRGAPAGAARQRRAHRAGGRQPPPRDPGRRHGAHPGRPQRKPRRQPQPGGQAQSADRPRAQLGQRPGARARPARQHPHHARRRSAQARPVGLRRAAGGAHPAPGRLHAERVAGQPAVEPARRPALRADREPRRPRLRRHGAQHQPRLVAHRPRAVETRPEEPQPAAHEPDAQLPRRQSGRPDRAAQHQRPDPERPQHRGHARPGRQPIAANPSSPPGWSSASSITWPRAACSAPTCSRATSAA